MIKISIIRKIKNNRWRIYSKKGKNLGTFDSEEAAEKHLKEIEFFKHKNALLDVALRIKTAQQKLTFSGMMRELRKNKPEKVESFLLLFKKNLDNAIKNNIQDHETAALMQTIQDLKNEEF